MKNLFPIRTGDLTYGINFNVPSTTGKWSVELGFSGVKEKSWGISGCSGKLYDNTGYNIGSYIADKDYNISGSIFENTHSIFLDGVLLSNQSRHEKNDYDMVEVNSTYVNSYMPSVDIQGRSVQNTNFNQTHEFWRTSNDRIYFVTENANADLGFVNQLRSMGFTVNTGNQSGVSGGQYLDNFYNLIIFGSATSSGKYNDGLWNSLNTNMMSLNSHLLAENNLNWYGSYNKVVSIDETGRSSDTLWYISPFDQDTHSYVWANFPDYGWYKMFYNPNTVSYSRVGAGTPSSYYDYHLEYGADESDSPRFVEFGEDHIGGAGKTEPGQENYLLEYTTVVSPRSTFNGLDDDIQVYYSGPQFVFLSNELGGTGTNRVWTDSNPFNKIVKNYNTGFIYRYLKSIEPEYVETDPTDYADIPIMLYTGVVETSYGGNGHQILHSHNTGTILNVWHKDTFWTGNTNGYGGGDFSKGNLVCFSVTPTGLDWQTGYNMWNTLTPTGQRIFVNTVQGFFV